MDLVPLPTTEVPKRGCPQPSIRSAKAELRRHQSPRRRRPTETADRHAVVGDDDLGGAGDKYHFGDHLNPSDVEAEFHHVSGKHHTLGRKEMASRFEP